MRFAPSGECNYVLEPIKEGRVGPMSHTAA